MSKSKYLLQAKKKIYSRFKGKLDEKLLIDQKTEKVVMFFILFLNPKPNQSFYKNRFG